MPRVKQFNEDDVLEKAVLLFWEKGYYATSMQDLVSHLGINRASLYDTFGDKQQLFEKALKRYIQTNSDKIDQLLALGLTPIEILKRFFQNVVDTAIQDPNSKGCFVVNTTLSLQAKNNSILEVLNQNQENLKLFFMKIVQKGQSSGDFNTQLNSQSAANYLVTLFFGMKVYGKQNSTQQELVDIVKLGLNNLL